MKNKIIETLETLSEKRISELTGAEISNLCYLIESYKADFFTSLYGEAGTVQGIEDTTQEFIDKKYFYLLDVAIQFFINQQAAKLNRFASFEWESPETTRTLIDMAPKMIRYGAYDKITKKLIKEVKVALLKRRDEIDDKFDKDEEAAFRKILNGRSIDDHEAVFSAKMSLPCRFSWNNNYEKRDARYKAIKCEIDRLTTLMWCQDNYLLTSEGWVAKVKQQKGDINDKEIRSIPTFR